MIKMIEEDVKKIIEGVGLPIHDLEGKSILISGACGFLGSWFISVFQYLNKNVFKTPCKVLAVDSFIATDKNNHVDTIDDPNIQFLKADISALNLEVGFDYIIHAAGVASPIYYRKYPIETIKGMVLGLINLLDYAVKYGEVKSILTFSSSEIYGNPRPEEVPMKESYNGNVSCTGPRSCYDESKRMEEAICVAYNRIHNLPVKWCRPFNVSGPGMRLADDRVLPKFIFSGLLGKPVTVHLPGTQTRTLCYITDAMIGFFKVLLIGKNGEVYNIGSEQAEIGMLALAEKVNEKLGGKLKIEKIEMPTEYPADQAQRRCPDLTKSKTELNYNPKVSLDETIERTIEWAKLLI